MPRLKKKDLLFLTDSTTLTNKERHLLNCLYALQDNCGGVCICVVELKRMAGISDQKTFIAAKKGLTDKNIITVQNRKDRRTGHQKPNYYQFSGV